MFAEYHEPSFLSYLLNLSSGDFREFIDCLSFLKQKQVEIDKVKSILCQLDECVIENLDKTILSELRRICRSYGVEIDEKNRDSIKTYLDEEIKRIREIMAIPDMGFEPDNLYSAVDVVKVRFDEYCTTYEIQGADIKKELKKVIDWLEENQNRFQQIN